MLRDGAQDYLDIHGREPAPDRALHPPRDRAPSADLRAARSAGARAVRRDPRSAHAASEPPSARGADGPRAPASAAHRARPSRCSTSTSIASRGSTTRSATPPATQVLVEVAARLARCTRRSDIVARVGGDEFLLLVTDVGGRQRARPRSRPRSRSCSRQPFSIEGREYWIGASIGIAVFPRDGEDADTLMRHADLALYQAKAGGRGTSRFYSDALNESVRRRHVAGARAAARARSRRPADRLPADLRRERRCGSSRPRRCCAGPIPSSATIAPAEFIAVAEHSGLIVPLGDAGAAHRLRAARAVEARGAPRCACR